MDKDVALEYAQQLLSGELSPEDFAAAAESSATAWIDSASVDLDRARRCGFPEVVYGEGKSVDSVVSIAHTICNANQDLLVTRVHEEQSAALQREFADGVANTTARTFRRNHRVEPHRMAIGSVAVATAGTSDLPVAEEVMETLRWMRAPCDLVNDIGVAGPQRLWKQAERLQAANVVVVVAGMEGALPSVVGGLVSAPVIAVPTSVGYGANLGGIAALLSMLNSCAANIAVVNIDAGFKAGYLAGLIAPQAPESP